MEENSWYKVTVVAILTVCLPPREDEASNAEGTMNTRMRIHCGCKNCLGIRTAIIAPSIPSMHLCTFKRQADITSARQLECTLWLRNCPGADYF